MDIGSIYNDGETSAFSIVKVQMFNDSKHGGMWFSQHFKPTSKFTLCGDIGFRHHILGLHVESGMFFLDQFLDCHIKKQWRVNFNHYFFF